jgi:hypothetical protein
MPETFINCGWASWTILLFSILSLGISFVSVILSVVKLPKVGAVFAIVSLLFALLGIANGPLGMMIGRSKTESALSGVGIEPSQKARIMEEGYKEAGCCLTVGFSLGTPSLVFSAGALALGAVLMKKQQPKAV